MRPRFGFTFDALQQRIVANRVLLLLRRVAVRHHPQMLAGVQVDRGDAADRSLEERQPGQRIGCGRRARRRRVLRRRASTTAPPAGASSPPLTPPRPATAPAFFAASGYISIAASTDAPVQPALVGTHAVTVVPVWPKQSSSLPGTTSRDPQPLCDGM